MKSVPTAETLNICVAIGIVALVSVANSDPNLEKCDKNITVNQHLNNIENVVMCADKSRCIGKINVCDGTYNCPDGSDEVACTNNPCKFFRCAAGGCLNSEKAECDGVVSCEDGSDEWHETCMNKCAKQSFRCNYGAYIYNDYVCDGVKNCADGSDEAPKLCMNNSCNEESFKCDYGGCISKRKMCDGLVDCVDGSDESLKLCSTTICPPNSFKCDNGSCIGKKQVCNGQVDCMDRSDESIEICSNFTCYGSNLLHRHKFRVAQ